MTTKTLDSPFGPVSFAVEDGFLQRVRFQAEINSTENDDPLAEEVAHQLDAYFAGRLFNFDLPLAPPHSEFQAGIRQCMIDIPLAKCEPTANWPRLRQRIPGRRTGLRREPHSDYRPLSPGRCRRRLADSPAATAPTKRKC